MADDIELPDPDGYVGDQSKPGAPLRPAYLARTVRRLIAERVATAQQAVVNACNETGRVFREAQEWRYRAEQAETELEKLRKRLLREAHDECPLWPPEDGR